MIKIFGNAIWQLVSQSDWLTWFVLTTLLFLSIISWSIFFYKLMIWKTKKRQLQEVLLQIKSAKNLEDILNIATNYSNSLPGYFLSKSLSSLKLSLSTDKGPKTNLTEKELEFLYNSIYNISENILHTEESYLPFVSVSAAISPLLGLFGTVWGLIHSFIDISKKQSADIVTVAPGIAEALITTLAGLIVAIPALILFYYLKLHASEIEQQLIELSDNFLAIVQKQFIKPQISLDQFIELNKPTTHVKEI